MPGGSGQWEGDELPFGEKKKMSWGFCPEPWGGIDRGRGKFFKKKKRGGKMGNTFCGRGGGDLCERKRGGDIVSGDLALEKGGPRIRERRCRKGGRRARAVGEGMEVVEKSPGGKDLAACVGNAGINFFGEVRLRKGGRFCWSIGKREFSGGGVDQIWAGGYCAAF